MRKLLVALLALVLVVTLAMTAFAAPIPKAAIDNLSVRLLWAEDTYASVVIRASHGEGLTNCGISWTRTSDGKTETKSVKDPLMGILLTVVDIKPLEPGTEYYVCGYATENGVVCYTEGFYMTTTGAAPTPSPSPTPDPTPTPEPEEIVITPGIGTAYVKDTYRLSADRPGVTWRSSNSKIATVSKKGVVKCKKAGEVVIMATDRFGAQGSINVSIINKLKSIKFTKSKLKLVLGEQSAALLVVPKPRDALFIIDQWTSSNENVAVVDEHGLVTAVGVGKAKIRAISDTGKKAACTVTVVRPKQ